jgi:hemolysin activation/secretion protein
VEGATALAPADFAPVIDRYVGRELTPDDLRALASKIAGVARAAGLGLATAWIPAQRVSSGVLRVVIDEGRVDAVEAEGDAAAVAERFLAPLANGRPVRTSELERQLLVAGDVAGIWVGKARLERRDGRNILRVQTRLDRAEGYASLDNWGSSTVGPERTQARATFNNLFTGADALTVGAVITPFQPAEFGLLRAAYATAIGTGGTEVSLSGYYAYSNPGGFFDGRDFEGRSAEVSAEVSHPLIRTRAASVWLYAGFGVRESVQSVDEVRFRRDRIAAFTLTAYGTKQFARGYTRGRIVVTQGIDAFSATDAGDALASRRDADGTFTKVDAWAEHVRTLGGRFTLQVASEAQVSAQPLLSSEELGLGGRSFLRGYDYRELSGERGIAGSVELRFDLGALPKPIREAQVYGYADAGVVGNLRDGRGGGTLASAGGGVRLRLGPVLQGELEIGIPLRDGAFGADRDPRLSFTLAAFF